MSLLRSGQTWEALGPFPLGTRELPYLSSPLHAFVDPSSDTDPFLSAPFGAVFPSAYGINGTASWLSLHPDEHGWVDVQWEPHLASWEGVRRSEGWAGLQHLALIRSEIDIPVAGDYRGLLVQGHSWSVVPQGRRRKEIEWVTGDIYAFSEGLGDEVDRQSVYGQVVHLDKGKHWVYLKALYEIRMFGDPQRGPPNIHLQFSLSHLDRETIVAPHLGPQAVLSIEPPTSPEALPRAFGLAQSMVGFGDAVEGWIWGNVAGIAVRAGREGLTVRSVTLNKHVEGLKVSLQSPVHLSSHQLRPLTLQLSQTSALLSTVDSVSLFISTSLGNLHLDAPISHLPADSSQAIRYVFLDHDGTTSYAMTHPPTTSKDKQEAVVLALHGAGVETSWSFWTEAVRPRERSWVVFPTGRTAWGYDWHGLSVDNVWSAKRQLNVLLQRLGKEALSDASVVIGHSNGGQGSTHLFLHHPDRLQASLSAAAYVKIQSYVAFTQWASSHHADPALVGLLLSGLAGNDEDVLAVNGVGLGRALVHGREDDNVPVWHGREMSNLHAQHSQNASLSSTAYLEVPGMSHWFDDILSSSFVEAFLSKWTPIASSPVPPSYQNGFELVVANPDEQGSKGGWRIVELVKVGRLAKLFVGPLTDGLKQLTIRTLNTRRFTFDVASQLDLLVAQTQIQVDSTLLALPVLPADASTILTFYRPTRSSPWTVLSDSNASALPNVRRYGPAVSILTTSGPLVLIVPSHSTRHQRIARSIAQDAWVYGRLDARIVTDADVEVEMGRGAWDGLQGNWIVVGGRENRMNELLRSTPLRFPEEGLISIATPAGKLTFDPTNHPSTGVIALHPHPFNPKGLALILAGTDAGGLERAFRLFPVRTGTPLLDWNIIGKDADWKGAGGLHGAGWWSGDWQWEESGSWIA